MNSINKNKLRVETMPLGKNTINGTSMEALRSPITARISTGISLFFFIFVFYLSPVGILVAQEVNKTPAPIVLTGTPEQKMNQGLLKVQEIADKKYDKINQRLVDEGSFLDNVLELIGLGQLTLEDVDELKQLSSLLAEQHIQAIASFNETKADLIAKNLPEVILQRHQDAVTKYQTSYDDMQKKLQAVLQADSLQAQQEASAALDTLMKGHKLKKSHQKTDPNNLPFGSPDASKTRKPANTPDQLSSLTGISNQPKPIMLAANVITPGMLGQPGGPVAEDLAETPDIKFTDAIKAKALELEDDPVKIYNWVRNNIEFIPSYGSIQGADYTLQHGKGNAFDTASLLIALYRAANIPARYAYGTVEVPVEKVMNWVGGVDVPEAAQQLLGQGGIPNVALVNGGKITHIRMETVWAEVWVDYFPSRAAKHAVGDQWIPLDASFKQYEFTAGENIEENVPFDAQGIVNEISQSATINETDGYVQGVNLTQVKAALANYQQQVEGYINSQNINSLTIAGKFVGSQKVILKEYFQLAAGLPFKLVARTNNYSELPNKLRHKFRYTLGTEYYGSESSRLITFEESLPALAGKSLALSFIPSTQADIDLIDAYLPTSDASGDVDISQLPDTLPGYLINLTAEFTQNGNVIVGVGAGTMGGELFETLALWSPVYGWNQAVNHPVAGEYRSIGLDLQGISFKNIDKLNTNIDATKEKLFDNSIPSQSLSKHDVVGGVLQSTIINYFALNDNQDLIGGRASNIIGYRLPSFGIFSTSLQTSYWFGIPRNVSSIGFTIDVDRLATQTVEKNNNKQKLVDYIKVSGYRASSLEHQLPEQMFSTDSSPAQAISAVKALSIAMAEGQKIWTVNKDNLSLALAEINLSSEIEVEIRNSVTAGNIATVHEAPVIFSGGNAVGYLLIDPETGSGAYKIGTGENGGFLTTLLSGLSGYLDGLTRFKDHWFNAGNAPLYAKISGLLTVVSAIVTVGQILSNPNLSVSDKIKQIVVNMGAAIATLGISQAIMANAFLAAANPILLGIFIATIAIAISILTIEILTYVRVYTPRRLRRLYA